MGHWLKELDNKGQHNVPAEASNDAASAKRLARRRKKNGTFLHLCFHLFGRDGEGCGLDANDVPAS